MTSSPSKGGYLFVYIFFFFKFFFSTSSPSRHRVARYNKTSADYRRRFCECRTPAARPVERGNVLCHTDGRFRTGSPWFSHVKTRKILTKKKKTPELENTASRTKQSVCGCRLLLWRSVFRPSARFHVRFKTPNTKFKTKKYTENWSSVYVKGAIMRYSLLWNSVHWTFRTDCIIFVVKYCK